MKKAFIYTFVRVFPSCGCQTYYVVIFSLLVGILIIPSLGSAQAPLEQIRVISTQEVFEGPGTNYTIILTLSQGTILPVLEKEGNWFRIQLTPELGTIAESGYIYHTAAELIGEVHETQESSIRVLNLQDSYQRGIGITLLMNNFGLLSDKSGFGIGLDYRKVITSKSEATITFGITGLRDLNEETIFEEFTDQTVIKDKYQRAISIPLLLGIRQRFFTGRFQDRFRFFTGASAGPVGAYSYPYFDDLNNNGYRDVWTFCWGREEMECTDYIEPINDIFSGMREGLWHFGVAGSLNLGIDIGRNFNHLSSVQISYIFYYFNRGIQILQPAKPNFDAFGQITSVDIIEGTYEMESFHDPQRFFSTIQFSIIIGWYK